MYIFESNENDKDGPVEKNNMADNGLLNDKETKEENSLENIRKGFVAWPDDQKPSELLETEIVEGRTKKGGYVAMPIK